MSQQLSAVRSSKAKVLPPLTLVKIPASESTDLEPEAPSPTTILSKKIDGINLHKITYNSIDTILRGFIRIVEKNYSITNHSFLGPAYRGASEALRHGVVGFIKDEMGNKQNYSKRFLIALKNLIPRTIENLAGFLAIKPNIFTSVYGRIGAGFLNMFVRILPRIGFVSIKATPSQALTHERLIDEFVGRTFMRGLPRNLGGMFAEQLGINMLLDHLPLGKLYKQFLNKRTETKKNGS